MKENLENPPAWATIAQYPLVKGPLLGVMATCVVTPSLKWTNHALNGEKMPYRNLMSGAGTYAASVIPSYVTAFTFKNFINNYSKENSQAYELLTSFAAGGLSGLACTPFEALAQNKQLTKPPLSTKETCQKMVAHNGYRALYCGGASIITREGLWSTVYMTAIPMMSASLQERGMNKKSADFFSVLTVAGSYGSLSAPLNQLRFKKQEQLIKPKQIQSYGEYAQEIWNQEPKASYQKRIGFFFKAHVPRAVTTTAAAGLMLIGSQQYDKFVKKYSEKSSEEENVSCSVKKDRF